MFFSVLYNVLMLMIEHKRTAVTVAACLLAAVIAIPVAVYAASSPEDTSPDIELVSSDPSAISDVLHAEDFEAGSFSQVPEKDPHDKGDGTSAGPDGEDELNTEETTGKPDDTENSGANDPSETTDATVAVPDNTFAVTVWFYDRESVTCMTGPATLRDIISSAGIQLRDTDRVQMDLDTVIKGACAVGVDSVEYKTVTVSEPIPYSVETQNVQYIPRGTTRVAQAGVNGSKDTVYTVEYLNGVEVSRTKEYDYIASYPTNQVNICGVGGTFTAPNGKTYSFSYVLTCKATYYNIHGTTATGLPTGDNIVAVDPSVIPLYSNVYIMNSDYDMGERIAADTGGAVKGNFVDIWMDVGSPNYDRFSFQGVAEMTVYILD